MRIASLLKRQTLGRFGLALGAAALAACAAGVLFDGRVRPLTSAEMEATLGLQTEDYECFDYTSGCCEGLACGTCPDCYQCTNDGPSRKSCQWAEMMTCTSLPDHDCGDLVQGFCDADCNGEFCDMADPLLVGSCGVISQCQ